MKKNGVVFYQTEQNRFDTIANFNLGPGKGWYTYKWDSLNCSQFIKRIKTTINDTGHISINGIYLKSMTVTLAPYTTTFTIIERIGPTFGFLYQYYECFFDAYGYYGNFSCYKDNQLGIYNLNNSTGCNFMSIKETPFLPSLIIDHNTNEKKFILITVVV